MKKTVPALIGYQITELETEWLRAGEFFGQDVIQWLNSGSYRGNNPFGGLWSSTHIDHPLIPVGLALRPK